MKISLVSKSHFVALLFLFIFLTPNTLLLKADEIIVSGDVSISATVAGEEIEEEDDGSGGGSSGSGGFTSIPASVTFSGIAYPNSPVFVLKNGQDFIETIANQNAQFTVGVPGLPAGSYTFSIVTEDTLGRRSTLYTFPLSISLNVATSISGIFLSPTISVSGQTIKKGNPLTIQGQGAPNATITISLKSSLQEFFSIQTGSSGLYSQIFDTSLFNYGAYQTKSKSILDEDESSYSSLVYFNIGDESTETECGSVKADLNCDFKVNLVDFSILAFWYRKDNPPDKVDLVIDGRVDIRDFSILAYAWTG